MQLIKDILPTVAVVIGGFVVIRWLANDGDRSGWFFGSSDTGPFDDGSSDNDSCDSGDSGSCD